MTAKFISSTQASPLSYRLTYSIATWHFCLDVEVMSKLNIARTEVLVSTLFLIPFQQRVRSVWSAFTTSSLLIFFPAAHSLSPPPLPHTVCSMLNFPNQGLNLCPSVGSTEPWPLDLQGRPPCAHSVRGVVHSKLQNPGSGVEICYLNAFVLQMRKLRPREGHWCDECPTVNLRAEAGTRFSGLFYDLATKQQVFILLTVYFSLSLSSTCREGKHHLWLLACLGVFCSHSLSSPQPHRFPNLTLCVESRSLDQTW